VLLVEFPPILVVTRTGEEIRHVTITKFWNTQLRVKKMIKEVADFVAKFLTGIVIV